MSREANTKRGRGRQPKHAKEGRKAEKSVELYMQKPLSEIKEVPNMIDEETQNNMIEEYDNGKEKDLGTKDRYFQEVRTKDLKNVIDSMID